MADPSPSTKFNLHAPVFDGGDADSFNLWLSQFQRYIRVTKPAEDDKLDLFLLCAGNQAAQYYNEVTWPELTQAEKDAGVTEFSRAVTFITNKFVSGKNILSERIKLYLAKQRPNQSLTDFYLNCVRLLVIAISLLPLLTKLCVMHFAKDLRLMA